MKVNFNRPFTDPFGNILTDKEGKPQMINRVLGLELFNLGDLDKQPLTQAQKYMAYTLSVKLANATEETDLTQEEADFIDNVASLVYKAGAYGCIKQILNGN